MPDLSERQVLVLDLVNQNPQWRPTRRVLVQTLAGLIKSGLVEDRAGRLFVSLAGQFALAAEETERHD